MVLIISTPVASRSFGAARHVKRHCSCYSAESILISRMKAHFDEYPVMRPLVARGLEGKDGGAEEGFFIH